jgi:peptide chain release factor 2
MQLFSPSAGLPDNATLISSLEEEARSLYDRARAVCSKSWLFEPTDSLGSYVNVRSGSGGTEASDWAGMLLRMYTRWAHHENHQGVQLTSSHPVEVSVKLM